MVDRHLTQCSPWRFWMCVQIRFAQIYQLSLQLVCIADRWHQRSKNRRVDLSERLLDATTTLMLIFAEHMDGGSSTQQRSQFEQARIKIGLAATLIDMSGVLHLVSPVELQKARAVIRKLRHHLFALQNPTKHISQGVHHAQASPP